MRKNEHNSNGGGLKIAGQCHNCQREVAWWGSDGFEVRFFLGLRGCAGG